MNIKFFPTLDQPMSITVDLTDDYEDVKEFTIQLTDEGLIVDFGDYTMSKTLSELLDLIVDEEEARQRSRENHPVYGDTDVWKAFQ